MAMQKRPASPGSIIQTEGGSGVVLDSAARVKGILERLFSDLKPNTLRAYQKAWDMLAEYLKLSSRVEALAYMTKLNGGDANALAMQWVADLQREGFGASTVSGRLAAIKGITRRLRIVGLIVWKIEVKGPTVTRYKDTAGPQKKSISNVLNQLRSRSDPKALRDVAILHALYTTGLRRGELAQLQLEHLDFEKARILITGKGRDDQEWVTLQPKAKEAIKTWLAARPGASTAVFVSLDPNSNGKPLTGNGIWKITTSYGLGRPHGIRHSGVTEVLDKTNGNIRIAQAFSRHKNPKTLMLYDDNRKNLAAEGGKILEDGL